MSDEKMSRSQAGKIGNKARVEKYGHEKLSAMAKQAAQALEQKRPGFHAEIGAIGGRNRWINTPKCGVCGRFKQRSDTTRGDDLRWICPKEHYVGNDLVHR